MSQQTTASRNQQQFKKQQKDAEEEEQAPEPDWKTLNEARQVNPLDVPPFWHIGTHARDEPQSQQQQHQQHLNLQPVHLQEEQHRQQHPHRTVYIGGGLTNRMISQEDCVIETQRDQQHTDTK